MRPAKSRRFIAFIFDMMVIGSLIQVGSSVLMALIQPEDNHPILIVTAVGYLLAILIYHLAVAGRVRFCTPGETMAGCCVEAEGKIWRSLFVQSRWFLFLSLFLLLIIPANAFEEMQRYNDYPFPQVFSRSLYVCLFLWSVYAVAAGRVRWAILTLGLMAPNFFIYYSLLRSSADMARIGLGVSGVQAICLLLSLLIYQIDPEAMETNAPRQIIPESVDGGVVKER